MSTPGPTETFLTRRKITTEDFRKRHVPFAMVRVPGRSVGTHQATGSIYSANADMVGIGSRIPKDDHAFLKCRAIANGTSIAAEIARLVADAREAAA